MSAVAERFKIRHRLPPARWPTREEAARARLFQPARIGPIVAEQRCWVPAMVPWRATDDGFVTDEVLAWYARFAEGRPGVLVVEATGIRDIASGPLLRIGDDRFVPGLRRLVETVRDRSDGRTRLFIQAIDFVSVRRRPEPEKFFRRFLDVDAQALHDGSLDLSVGFMRGQVKMAGDFGKLLQFLPLTAGDPPRLRVADLLPT